MTLVIFLDGVHGVGKTTVKNEVAKRLQNAGLRVYSFPEMSYYPDIEIGSLEFQLWFKNDIAIRDEAIKHLETTGLVDVILVDRHYSSIELYTEYVKHGEEATVKWMFDNLDLEPYHILIHLDRSNESIRASVKERIEREPHRAEWNEDDDDYLYKIKNLFYSVRFSKWVKSIRADKFEDTCDTVITLIYNNI